MNDTFSTYNPIINFTFFIGAIALGMFFVHPAFLCASVILSFAYYLTVKRGKGIKLIFTLLPVFIALSLINPLFNTYGETVLFTYFNRSYTLEALYYGMATAAMLVSVISWFASYNAVMTSDKFIYIFGKMIPSLSLVFTMVLRLIPNYQRKITQIAGARKCIGKYGTGKGTGSVKGVRTRRTDASARAHTEAYVTKRETEEQHSKQSGSPFLLESVGNGLTIVSALTSWALEGAIITADSMKSRGYGSEKRTNFAIYRFTARDKLLLVFMLLLISLVIIAGSTGAMAASFTPELYITPLTSIKTLAALIAYILLLFVPTALNISESLLWKIRVNSSFNKRE